MNFETASFSMYSDISTLISDFSSPKTSFARVCATRVLPTPVGPTKRKLPIGLSGDLRPALPRRIALETAVTAASWPMTFLCRVSSSFNSFFDSELFRLPTGIWVQSETIPAMSVSSRTGIFSFDFFS